MADSYEFDVFLSHHSADKAEVRKLKKRLEADRLRVWLDEDNIPLGAHIPGRVQEGLDNSRRLLLIMTRNGFASKWVAAEVWSCLQDDPTNSDGRLVPVRFDDCKIDRLLKTLNYVDYRQRDENQYRRLVDFLRSPLDVQAPEPPVVAPEAASMLQYPDDEESADWIVKTFDHRLQLPVLRDSLLRSREAAVAVVDGCSEDLPEYLAHRVFLDDLRDPKDKPRDPTPLYLSTLGSGSGAFWEAIYWAVLGATQGQDISRIQREVRDWLGGQRHGQLLYIPVQISHLGLALPRLLRGARQFLEELDLDRHEGLLILLSFETTAPRLPWLWCLWRRCWLMRRRRGVYWLKSLHKLTEADIRDWFAYLNTLKLHVRKDPLKRDLKALFEGGVSAVRYQRVKDCLIDEGSLRRARITR